MSTDYRSLKKCVGFKGLKRHCKAMGLEVSKNADSTADRYCLTDGTNYIWVCRVGNNATSFTRFGSNNVEGILKAISDYYDVELVSEYDGAYFK